MANSLAGSSGATFAVFAALVYDIIAAACSSPQTTELNAGARSETLMKWVGLGLLQAAVFVAIGAAIEAKRGAPIWPPIAGGALAGGLMYSQYVHARNSGLASAEPPTETYEPATGIAGY